MRILPWRGDRWLDRVLVLVLSSLLVALAVLQHRWTRAAAETEKRRLRTALFERLENFRREVDRATSQAVLSFWLDPEWVAAQRDWRAVVGEAGLRAMQEWQTAAAFPRLLRDVHVVALSDGGRAELLRLDPSGEALASVPWPAELRDFERAFVRAPQGDLGWPSRASRMARLAYGVLPEIPAFVLPLLVDVPGPGKPGEEDAAGRRLRACLLVRLDREYVEREWLPALTARYLPDSDYDLAVRAGEESASFLYVRAGHSPETLMASFDAGIQLLMLSMEELEPLLEERVREAAERPARRGPPGSAESRREIGRDAIRSDAVTRRSGYRQLVQTTMRHDPEQVLHLSRSLGERGWQLRVRHVAGSIEAATRRSQLQNLALSYGILLLLASSVAMAVLTARRARRLARRQMEFVASVSHELRTPIAVIRALSSNMAEGLVRSDAQVETYGRHLHRESGRLGDVVERTLEYAGISSGRPFRLTSLDMTAVVRQALDACAELLHERETRLETAFEEDLPAVRGDTAALVCVVRNLVENAARYSPKGTAVHVSLRRAAARLELAVADAGPGIHPADLRHLFEPFYRGRHVVEAGVRGVGIGLTLARRIAIAHGGAIRVASRLGQGTTFTVELPVAEGA